TYACPAFDMAACRTAREENDHAGTPFDHLTGSGTCSDELRFQHGIHENHEFINREVNGILSDAVIADARSDGVELDIDGAVLTYDLFDILINQRVIQGVNCGGLCSAACLRDLLCDLFNTCERPPSKVHFGALRGKLLGYSRTDRASRAEND